MPDLPIVFSSKRQSALGTSGAAGTTVSSAGVTNTKGSWTALSTSTPHHADYVEVTVSALTGVAVDALIDIGVGSLGSERIIIADLPLSSGASLVWGLNRFVFHIPIPAGSRVSARMQSTNVTQTCVVSMRIFQADGRSTATYGRVTTLGVGANTTGVTVDPGGTTATKGAWVPISTSTPAHFRRFSVGVLNKQNNLRAASKILLDIGVGVSGSEKIVAADMELRNPNTGVLNSISPVPITIPVGSRLSARASNTEIASGNNRTFDVIIYGES